MGVSYQKGILKSHLHTAAVGDGGLLAGYAGLIGEPVEKSENTEYQVGSKGGIVVVYYKWTGAITGTTGRSNIQTKATSPVDTAKGGQILEQDTAGNTGYASYAMVIPPDWYWKVVGAVENIQAYEFT